MTSNDEFIYELKIPKDRIGALIGIKGKEKSFIEEHTYTTISVDSKEGEIIIKGGDGLGLYTAREIVKAIGRGFNPEIANLLLNDDYALEVIDVNSFTRKNKSLALRLKGRVIGAGGKSRSVIENLTDTHISVYGKTVSIIGVTDAVIATRKAIESLLQGSKHANVYKSLEIWRKKRRHESS